MPSNVLSVSGRVFVALCKAGPRAKASVYHAVTPHCRIALCTAEPGARSEWAEPPGHRVTCPACLKRLSQLGQSGSGRDRARAAG